jgi:hypothetical protein
VARHLPFAYPFVDGIALNAEVVSNLVYGKPAITCHSLAPNASSSRIATHGHARFSSPNITGYHRL